MNTIDILISAGYYVSSLVFLVATIISYLAVKKFGKSSLGSILSYFFIGTAIFFIITIFQKIAVNLYDISFGSMDFWWHIMFYLALSFYFIALKLLVSLGETENVEKQIIKINDEKKWGITAIIVLVLVFILPSLVDSQVNLYLDSVLGKVGLHHFISFAFSAIVSIYLFSVKNKLGQIGKVIANPLIIAIIALSLQHFWELLFESWMVVEVTEHFGEGIEKIFLIIAASCVCYIAYRLKNFGQTTS